MKLATWLVGCCVLGFALPSAAQSPYQTPPAKLARMLDRAPTPGVTLSPDKSTMLLLEYPAMRSIEDLSQPELRLAGLRINPRTNGPSRVRPLTGMTIQDRKTGAKKPVVGIPKGDRIGSPSWSPDGRSFAFTGTSSRGIALFVASTADGKARRITDYVLNETTGRACSWFADSKSLACRLVPAKRGAAPTEPRVPKGPVVQESSGRKAPARTYQDLLSSPHDEALFEHYFTSSLALVTTGGDIRRTSISGILVDVRTSPDGRHVLTQTLRRPYSYLVPYSRFPTRVDVYDRRGKRVKTIAKLPLREEVPIGFGSVPVGPRRFEWRADAPATVVWAEALDGGDVKKKVKYRDRVLMHAAPFRGRPTLLAKLRMRYGGVTWGTDQLALVNEWMWQTRKTRTWMVAPARPKARPTLLWDRSFEDRYSDPGSPVMRKNPAGFSVIETDGTVMHLSGKGASPEGDRPFLDRMTLATRKSERLWRSQAPYYESFVGMLEAGTVVTRRESKTEPPNYYERNLASGKLRPLTAFAHPHPELRGIEKELIRYQRADGVKLTATLYTPPGWTRKKGRLPMVMWAYPQEFKSAAAAGQTTDSPYRFARVGWWSPLPWLLRGYAVLDDPSMPIVGEGNVESNDSFVTQLVSSASAAVDEVVRRGVADRDRIAIGGHSYGAFMAANLLAHSDLFRAAIARSGAYNRTLTPFGFQAEERTLWQAPDVYFAMSPFMHADKIDEPLLLIHGDSDNNSGTFPLQSRRLYAAVKGLGGTVRLVMLPHESHGYRARASIMHMMWETSRWLDEHVKNAKPRAARKRPRRASRR